MTTYSKIRKNASKKIAALIESATYITYNGKQSAMDDSFDSLEPREIEANEVIEFMETNYADLEVRLHECGKVTIHDGPYYFCDKVVLHVKPRPVKRIESEAVEVIEKPRMSFGQVSAMLKAGFISPLTHGAKICDNNFQDENKIIEEVIIKMGEGPTFFMMHDRKMTIDEFNRLAWLALHDQRQYVNKCGQEYGYDKIFTKLKVKGQKELIEYRFDLSIKTPSLSQDWSYYVDYCYVEQEKRQANDLH